MAINFPDTPTPGQNYTTGGITWQWDGVSWLNYGTGTPGAQGVQGTAGSVQGLQGATGSQGATGAQGQTGIQGFTGAQGTTGSQGATGAQGQTGIQGFTGAQGTTGSQGAQGVQGVAIQGSQGLVGVQGLSGGNLYFTFGGTGTPTTGNDKTPYLRAPKGVTTTAASLSAKTAPSGGTFQASVLKSSDSGATFPTTVATVFLNSGAKVNTNSTSVALTSGDLLRLDISSVNGAADWTFQIDSS